MSSVNKVIILGNLGSKPELKNLQDGTAVSNFSVATNKKWTDKSGQKQEKTEWHRVVVWGKQAENCAKYLDKGRTVYVEGELQTRSWEKDGQKHYTTEVNAQTVQFVGGGNGGGHGTTANVPAPTSAPQADFTSDDIPF
jgi:single-strand DNA-binding protein